MLLPSQGLALGLTTTAASQLGEWYLQPIFISK